MLEHLSRAAFQPVLSRATTELTARLASPSLLVGRDQTVVSANAALGALFGVDAPSLRGRPLFDVAERLLDRPEVCALAPDGGEGWQEVQDLQLDLAVPGLGRRIVGLTVVRITARWFDTGLTLFTFLDATQRTLLAEERARLAAAFEQATNAIAITDAEGLLTYANPAFGVLAESNGVDLVGMAAAKVIGERLSPLHPEVASALWSGDGWSGSLAMQRPGGSTALLDVVTASVLSAEGGPVGHVFTARDVTRERRVEAELRREVGDRAAVARGLSRLRIEAAPELTAIELCEEICRHPGLDSAAVLVVWGRSTIGTMAVNGAVGSVHAGRRLSSEVTHHLQRQAESGPWVERCDGERASAYGRLWAAAGMSAIASVPIVGSDELLGIVAVGSHTDDSAGLSQRWAPILEFGAMASALLSGPLAEQRAVASRQHEIWSTVAGRRFDPVFQPIVELDTGRVVGYEALTRFHDGSDPSARFARAREAGLGLVLEEACLREALRDAAGLAPEAWLSLNASARYVMDVPRLRRLLAGGSRPIVLEITEHEAVADPAAIRDALVSLGDRVRTIRLAVDDAGAGFNGLRFILGLAPDLIKLDLNLTLGIEQDPAKQALVVGMRHFAGQIGAQLIAEGVETRQALDTLQSLGVALGQGYLLGSPAPVAAWRADGALGQATDPVERDAPGPQVPRAALEGDSSAQAKGKRKR